MWRVRRDPEIDPNTPRYGGGVGVGTAEQGRLPKLSKGSLGVESTEAQSRDNYRRMSRDTAGHQAVFLPTGETWNLKR